MTTPLNSRFIGEPIAVEFDSPPMASKRPHCPDRFTWGGETFQVAEVLGQNTSFGRRGRMADNMAPEHDAHARLTGSWGVGRYSFEVRTTDGRQFELYYDRAPKSANDRAGSWFLRLEWLSAAT